MTVHIKLFASAREKACADSIELTSPLPVPLYLLRSLMDETAPALRGMPGRWAVNLEFAEDDYVVQSGDELAWIPPVCGG